MTATSLPRNADQPSSWRSRISPGRRSWVRRSRVPPPDGASSTRTRELPGGRLKNGSVQPQLTSRARGGSSSTYSPSQYWPCSISNRKRPPGRGSSSAARPIQRTSRDGSTNIWKTSSGGAASSTSCTTSSPSIPAPPRLRQAVGQQSEPCSPELVKERPKAGEVLHPDAVKAAVAVDPHLDESCLTERAKMLRRRSPCETAGGGECARADLAPGHHLEHSSLSRVGDHAQGRLRVQVARLGASRHN